MDSNTVASKRTINSGSKVKTGCATCRIRKVKCDEKRPSCQRCVNTGRRCDGYLSPFRSQYIKDAPLGSIESGVELRVEPTTMTGFSPQDARLLNRYFSTKTMSDVQLACGEEAKQVLQASLTHLPIRHAILSLKALRDDLESSKDVPVPRSPSTSGYNYGLQQYNMALMGLASDLSFPGYDTLKSALLCCQLFISIEQARADYAAMAQHIIRGIDIMHENRARPGFDSAHQLVRARHDRLPVVDVFVIKLFAAPCRLALPPTISIVTGNTLSADGTSRGSQSPDSDDHRKTVSAMAAELKGIALSTLAFLDRVGQVELVDQADRLLAEKMDLIKKLHTWITELDHALMKMNYLDHEPLSILLMRFLHELLKTVLVGALDSSLDLKNKLQIQSDRFQDVADQERKSQGLWVVQLDGSWSRGTIRILSYLRQSSFF